MQIQYMHIEMHRYICNILALFNEKYFSLKVLFATLIHFIVFALVCATHMDIHLFCIKHSHLREKSVIRAAVTIRIQIFRD